MKRPPEETQHSLYKQALLVQVKRLLSERNETNEGITERKHQNDNYELTQNNFSQKKNSPKTTHKREEQESQKYREVMKSTEGGEQSNSKDEAAAAECKGMPNSNALSGDAIAEKCYQLSRKRIYSNTQDLEASVRTLNSESYRCRLNTLLYGKSANNLISILSCNDADTPLDAIPMFMRDCIEFCEYQATRAHSDDDCSDYCGNLPLEVRQHMRKIVVASSKSTRIEKVFKRCIRNVAKILLTHPLEISNCGTWLVRPCLKELLVCCVDTGQSSCCYGTAMLASTVLEVIKEAVFDAPSRVDNFVILCEVIKTAVVRLHAGCFTTLEIESKISEWQEALKLTVNNTQKKPRICTVQIAAVQAALCQLERDVTSLKVQAKVKKGCYKPYILDEKLLK